MHRGSSSMMMDTDGELNEKIAILEKKKSEIIIEGAELQKKLEKEKQINILLKKKLQKLEDLLPADLIRKTEALAKLEIFTNHSTRNKGSLLEVRQVEESIREDHDAASTSSSI